MRSSEFLPFRLQTFNNGDRHEVLGKTTVYAQHAKGFLFSVLIGCVRSVTFLPKELGRAKEQARAHLPSNDVTPLIEEQGKIAVRLDPVLVRIPDDCFGCRPDDQRFFEFLTAGVRHDGYLRREPLNVFGFLLEKAFGNQHWEIGILMPRLLEHPIESLLHLFPNGVAVWPDDHAALDRRIIRQFGRSNHIRVPSRVVFAALGNLRFGHNSPMISFK